MNRSELEGLIKDKKSCLCVGLDSDYSKLPSFFPPTAEGVMAFNEDIIKVTKKHCVAYKLNTAFYEVLGAEGWAVLEETIGLIGSEHFVIADAKRGDIGNTAKKYAETFFVGLQADAITLSPYMGGDTLLPFLNYSDKWSIVLALTSNPGAKDIQWLSTPKGNVYKEVVAIAKRHANPENCMFVVGGTRPEDLKSMRDLCPDYFFLVPGVGKQGGTVASVMQAGKRSSGECGLLINSSRSIIFASKNKDYAKAAEKEAQKLSLEMREYL